MHRTSPAARASRLAVAGVIAGLVSLTGSAAAVGAPKAPRPATAVACKKGTHKVGPRCVRNKPKPKPKPVIAAIPAPAPAPLAPAPAAIAPAPPACQESGLFGLLSPFLTHLSAAHLEESPFQQVHDLLNTDQYVLIHTAMLDSMLAGLGPVVQSVLNGDLNGAVTRLLSRTCASS
ncbi:MAG: hypothetical protein QOK40_1841 [Miltoncostaeaceae bacterium]|nr:hypothetical protein [Miltoncostaeaceae bacterium]